MIHPESVRSIKRSYFIQALMSLTCIRKHVHQYFVRKQNQILLYFFKNWLTDCFIIYTQLILTEYLLQNKIDIQTHILMKKEELAANFKIRPINLLIVPLKLEVPFQEKLKLQLAFYRHNKVCKTNPMKFLRSNIQEFTSDKVPIISFTSEELTFCTTIGYDKKIDIFQSKQINVQIACDTNGVKQILEAKLDLNSFMKNKPNFECKNIQLEFSDNEGTIVMKLLFSLKVKFEDMDELKLTDSLTVNQKKDKSQGKLHEKQYSTKQIRIEKSTENTSGEIPKHHYQSHNLQNDKKKKHIAFEEPKISAQTQMPPSPPDSPKFYNDTQSKNQSEKLDRKKSKHKLKTKNEQKTDNDEQIKRIKGQITNLKETHAEELSKLNSQISKLKSLLQVVQKKNHDLEKEHEYFQKKEKKVKNQLVVKNEEIKELRKEIKEWQSDREQKVAEKDSNLSEMARKCSDLQKKLKNVGTGQEEWRKKYQESEQSALKLMSEKSELQYQLEKAQKDLQKAKKQFQSDRSQFQQQLQSIRDQYSKKRLIENGNEQVQKLRKQLLKKQQIIKRLQKSHDNKQNQLEKQFMSLKKQNTELKETIQGLRKSDKSDNSSALELKIVSEKLKKECEVAKKMEKNLLMDKSQLESRNKNMSEELIRLKETIAKMLNLIQEQGSPELFTQVTDCIM